VCGTPPTPSLLFFCFALPQLLTQSLNGAAAAAGSRTEKSAPQVTVWAIYPYV